MAALITTNLFFLSLFFVPSFAHNSNKLISCDNKNSAESLNYQCNRIGSENQCGTFAVLHTNPYYSSLYNLSYYLGLNRFTVAQENGFSTETEFLSSNQPLLIPVNCKCAEKERVFQAELVKTTDAGESFDGIAESLEGLTTCKAIQEKNAGVPKSNLQKNVKISVPVRCACPSSTEISSGIRLLVSYAVNAGDSLISLAAQFNTTTEAIISANKRSKEGSLSITDHSLSVLIPLKQKPLLGSLAKPSEPSLGFPSERSTKATEKKKRKKKKKKMMMKIGICIGVVAFVVVATIAGFAVFFFRERKKKQQQNCLSSKIVDHTELQQLSLSIRTVSEKKVSFEGSQSTLDGQGEPLTPRSNTTKMMLETYTVDEMKKATEDFGSHNLIEGTVYHGRNKGKDMAIKRTTLDYISKVDLTFFHDAIHNHPNIMRVLGTCIVDDEKDSYLVFEYAKNGSLKDWIHGGLAMKSQFIASCSCFLTWRQRLRICLDVALALQYMHHIMHPIYVHRNIKSKNIFLDEEFNAKVGNFGMSKCVEDEVEETKDIEFSSRNPSSWDKGYLAPEYNKHGIFSPSIDIYAFGVVLLEMLSGETPVLSPKEGEIVMLSDKIKSILQTENVDELRCWLDADLGENFSFDGAIALATLGRACIDEDPSMRPSAGEIVEKLSRLIEESVEEQTYLINESSSKPLVQTATSNSSNSDN